MSWSLDDILEVCSVVVIIEDLLLHFKKGSKFRVNYISCLWSLIAPPPPRVKGGVLDLSKDGNGSGEEVGEGGILA